MKIMLVVAVMLSMSACAGVEKKEDTALIVSGSQGEVLRVQGNGKIRWAVKRDEAARVMIGLLLKSKQDLEQIGRASCRERV